MFNAIHTFQFLVGFNFVKLVFFYSTHSSHYSHLFDVSFAFTIVSYLFCLLEEKDSVIVFWTLNFSCWNKNSLFYESKLKNVWKKKKWICLMIKKCVEYIWYCCLMYLIGYIVSALFTLWSLVFFLILLIRIKGFPREKIKKRPWDISQWIYR